MYVHYGCVGAIPTHRVYRLSDMEKLSGASTFCLFGQGAKISLAQIILGNDYSGSVNELR